VETPDVKTSEDRSLFMNQVPGVRTAGFRLEDVLPVCTRKAVEFIERHAQNAKGKPFFLYMPLTAPHLPVVPNQQFRGRSRAGDYGDFVVEMDSTVGAVLDVLDRTRLSGNTIVLFTSDNGGLWHWWDFRETDDVALGRISERGKYLKSRGHQSNAYLRGTKADIWEGGHRVPFLVRWPGRIKPGTVSDDLVCLTDVLATVAEITSTPLAGDAAEDSFSALAVMTGKGGAAIDRAVVLHSLHGEFAIRQGEWKLALSRGSGGFSVPRQVTPKQDEPAGQLYNLREDPLEKRNVYLEQPDVVARLSRLLEQYQREGRSRPLRH
jgi:arylsulfatase A-like enzyme